MREAPEINDDARQDVISWPVRCGQRTVRVTVKTFHVSSDLLTPRQAEEATVTETLLQGIRADFLRAGRGTDRWYGGIEERVERP